MEQITEFQLIDPRIPVGGTLMAHDAKLRKGKWLVPYVSTLDNWECKLHDISDEGLFVAKRKLPASLTAQKPPRRPILLYVACDLNLRNWQQRCFHLQSL